MRIYICGNPLVEEDDVPLKILPQLRQDFPNIEFLEYDSIEELEGDAVIIDTVEGIDAVRVIDDIGKIQQHKLCSMHDFDLGSGLKLLKKIGKIDNVKIIGIPKRMIADQAIEGVKRFIGDMINQ